MSRPLRRGGAALALALGALLPATPVLTSVAATTPAQPGASTQPAPSAHPLAAPPARTATGRRPSPVTSHPVEWTGELGTGLGSSLGNGRCDVNGDGYDDVVAGGWFWDKAPYKGPGAAYVMLGSARPQGGVLDDPTHRSAVRINGPSKAFAGAGFSVACLGDTDGDGYDDVAVSDFADQRVYVVRGSRDFRSLNLDAMGDRGYIVQAPADAGNFGYQVVGLGDVNHDGRADIGITAVVAGANGRKASGRAWVVAGGAGTTTVDVTTSPRVLGTVDGARAGDRLSTIAPAGDVNGDHVPDLVVGAYVAVPDGSGHTADGAAYVVYGRRDGRIGEVDTAAMGDHGFVVRGPARQRDRLGISVAPVGDVNHDGLADLVIGADGVSSTTTGPRQGGAAIVYGSRSGRTVQVDPTSATQTVYDCATDACEATGRTTRGWWIRGAADGDSTGYSVAGAGDVNHDGIPDVVLGAFGADGVGTDGKTLAAAGKAYLVYGRRDAAVVDLATLDGTSGLVTSGTHAGERLGRAVAMVGDVDHNGSLDLAAGGDDAGGGAGRAGAVQVHLFGQVHQSGPTSGRRPDDPTWPMLPNRISDSVPQSMAFSQRNWTPTAQDTCPASLHAQYSMVAYDGKRYPTWHPAQVWNPATGRMCSFGHEHGDDPRTSHIYGWVASFLSDPKAHAPGIPFGDASEASMTSNGGMDMRHEDNVGHKIVVANDVPLLRSGDRSPVTTTVHGRQVPVSCDYLIKLHQGTHSSDATKNNAHELMYAVSCTDGTQAIITTLSRLGNPNEYTRGCDEGTTVKTTGSTLPAGSGGRRLIPDTACMDKHELVPAGQRSDVWGLYEVWQTANQITKPDGTVLASYDPWLAVRNPSRVADTANPGSATPTILGRWATDAADQGIARGWPWTLVPQDAPHDQQWVGSPFNGAQRDSYLGGTTVANAGGPTVWYTDPYGRNASPTPFPGSVRQLITNRSGLADQHDAERVNLGLEDDFGAPGTGVHAPN